MTSSNRFGLGPRIWWCVVRGTWLEKKCRHKECAEHITNKSYKK